jgi:hypothetical protein
VSTQLALRFDEVEVDCPSNNAITPSLRVLPKRSPAAQARSLNVAYSTVTLAASFVVMECRDCFPLPSIRANPTRRSALSSPCCTTSAAPRASDRELARAVGNATGHRLHNETVKALLERYFFWRYAEFRRTVQYPVPADPVARRFEMLKLYTAGRSSIAVLLQCHQNTVRKWLRRARHQVGAAIDPCSPTYRVRPITRTAKCRWV